MWWSLCFSSGTRQQRSQSRAIPQIVGWQPVRDLASWLERLSFNRPNIRPAEVTFSKTLCSTVGLYWTLTLSCLENDDVKTETLN